MKRNSSPSSPRSAPAPDLALQPSRRWRTLVATVHVAALVALAFVPWPILPRLLLALALLASAGVTLRSFGWTRLVVSGEGRCRLYDRAGAVHEARLLRGGLRHPWLVTLPLRFADGRRGVVAIWADAVPSVGHAALRRWLLGEPSPGGR